MPVSVLGVCIWDLEASLARQFCGHETAAIIFVLYPHIFTKKFDSLFNTVLVQDGLIFDDDVGWLSGFNKVGDSIDNIDIGLRDILEDIGTNNQVSPSHAAPIVFTVIVVDGSRIP